MSQKNKATDRDSQLIVSVVLIPFYGKRSRYLCNTYTSIYIHQSKLSTSFVTYNEHGLLNSSLSMYVCLGVQHPVRRLSQRITSRFGMSHPSRWSLLGPPPPIPTTSSLRFCGTHSLPTRPLGHNWTAVRVTAFSSLSVIIC